MLSTTIEIAYVNPPKPGKKTGSVKTTNDEIYGVWPSDLGRFEVGNTYTVQYEEREFQGQIYKTIKFPKGANGGRGVLQQQSVTTTPASGQTKACEMFVMGIIGRYLQGSGAGFPGTEELTSMVRSAVTAWDKGFAAPKTPTYKDLNDEIPPF